MEIIHPACQVLLNLGIPGSLVVGLPRTDIALLSSVDGREIGDNCLSEYECHFQLLIQREWSIARLISQAKLALSLSSLKPAACREKRSRPLYRSMPTYEGRPLPVKEHLCKSNDGKYML
ncbi:hypothetical protein BBI10_04135 [Pseudomonas graminis]|uniref:Uncharacterized protein n=1 Tax=Pseudomonas graminis TaxID=158627 RepID=A0A1C2ECL7_9PSED|nr:hypothetical protein BBI10_04135 [Pseudomonas graminis]